MAPSPSMDTDKALRVWVQYACWIVAGIFAALATLLSLQIRGHLRSFSKPMVQRKIVGILWIVPIYAINSWISLRFMNISVYVDMLRDSYEAYVLHLFLSLMVSYLCHPDGNRRRLDSVLAGLDDDHKVLPHMFPFTCMFKPWPVDHDFLQICYRGTLLLLPQTAHHACSGHYGIVWGVQRGILPLRLGVHLRELCDEL